MSRRYEGFTYGEPHRRLQYQVRKYLHFTWEEWDALPWWQAQSYYEMLSEDLYPTREDGGQATEENYEDDLLTRLPRLDGPQNSEDIGFFGFQVESVGE